MRRLPVLHDNVRGRMKDKGVDNKVQVLDVAEIVARGLQK